MNILLWILIILLLLSTLSAGISFLGMVWKDEQIYYKIFFTSMIVAATLVIICNIINNTIG